MKNQKVIYRYEIENTKGTFTMPVGAEVVDAVWQQAREAFSVYALCNPKETEMVERKFEVFGTGHEIEGEARFIRSICMPDGFHVFHVMELL